MPGCPAVVDYPSTSRISTVSSAAAALLVATLALLVPGPVNPLDLSLTLVLALAAAAVCTYDAWRAFQDRVRELHASSHVAAALGVGLLLVPFLLDPQGAAARPLHATLQAGLAITLATFSAHTAWASVAAGVPIRAPDGAPLSRKASAPRTGTPPPDRL